MSVQKKKEQMLNITQGKKATVTNKSRTITTKSHFPMEILNASETQMLE